MKRTILLRIILPFPVYFFKLPHFKTESNTAAFFKKTVFAFFPNIRKNGKSIFSVIPFLLGME